MTKQEISYVKEKLSALIGEPLRLFDRAGPLAILDFGEMVEINTFMRDENGNFLRDENGRGVLGKKLSGRYLLNINTSLRFSIGNHIITGNSDMSLPNDDVYDSAIPEFTFDNFNWQTDGNLFDQQLERHFCDKDYDSYIVKDINITKFGDLTITFENDFVIETFCNSFTRFEDWTFADRTNDKGSITISGGKISTED